MTGRNISRREDISYVGDNSAIFLRYVFKFRFIGESLTPMLYRQWNNIFNSIIHLIRVDLIIIFCT